MVEEKGGKAEVADARGDTGDALCSTRGDIFTQKTKYIHVINATKRCLKAHKLLVKKVQFTTQNINIFPFFFFNLKLINVPSSECL